MASLVSFASDVAELVVLGLFMASNRGRKH